MTKSEETSDDGNENVVGYPFNIDYKVLSKAIINFGPEAMKVQIISEGWQPEVAELLIRKALGRGGWGR